MEQTIISQDGARVSVTLNGRWLGSLPWQAAKELARAIQTKAKRAEEWDKALALARDQAILTRAGAPFGLTDHPRIQAEAAKLAAWDRDLRRYLPGGVRSAEIVGAPAVRHIT